MKLRDVAIASCALLILTLVPRPTDAYWSHATAWNSTNECARVQFFTGKSVTGATGAHYQPAFLLRPGGHLRQNLIGPISSTGKLPLDVITRAYTVLARFEVLPGAACTGSPVGRNHEKSATESNPFKGSTWNVRLLGTPGHYRLQ